MLLVLRMLPKQHDPRGMDFTMTPEWHQDQDQDPSSPVGCEVETPWIKMVGSADSTDAQLD